MENDEKTKRLEDINDPQERWDALAEIIYQELEDAPLCEPCKLLSELEAHEG